MDLPFYFNTKVGGKVCYRGLSLYEHKPGLIVGCFYCSTGIYVEWYIDQPVPLVPIPQYIRGC